MREGGADPLLGTSLGSYRVVDLLGVGGMGRVYKGEHPGIGSRVAIKVLSRECADDRDLVERFFSEARAVNLIRHESIVNVLDLATLPDGRPYIVMEYLDGAPLSSIMAERGPLPLGSLARLMGEVLDALGAAHAASIVHRDLKPDNIFVSPQGRAKVLDFGIAKLMPELSGRSGPTRTGSLLGTPHYMAPEQALARPIDARTDLYAVGVILFEGATGRKPFTADSLFDLLRKHVDEPPPPPRSLRPDMTGEYESIILGAMAKAPAQRFQSATAIANALAHATQPLPPEAWVPLGPAAPSSARIGPPSMHTPSGGRPLGEVSTVSSGQGQIGRDTVRDGRGRKGLWIGAGLLAAAGIATVIALAVRQDGAAAPVATSDAADAGVALAASHRTSDAAPTADGTARAGATIAAAPPADAAAPAEAGDRTAGDRGRAEPATRERDVPDAPDETPTASRPAPPKPGRFDPASFDVTGYLPRARALARGHYDDAVLVRIDASGVRPDGRADLTLSDSFTVLYRFVSPSRAERPDDLPKGVPFEPDCKYYVYVDQNGIRPYPLDGWTCDEPLIGPPSCSARKVWKKALSLGASKDAVARVGYWADGKGRGRWSFDIEGGYSSWIADDCP